MSIKNIIVKLNNAVKQKKNVIHISCGVNINKIVLQFLTILENQGFIESWYINDNNIIIIKLVYDAYGLTPFNKILFLSNLGKPIFIKTSNLWRRDSINSFLILNSPKGLISENEARTLNIGGKAFCLIY